MYCKNCGAQLQPGNPTCLTCGANVGDGNAYCSNCGNAVTQGAVVCTNCGFQVNTQAPTQNNTNYLNGQDKVLMIVLAIFLGNIGVHNFVLGETKKGIAKILLTYVASLLTCGVTSIVSLVLIIIDIVKIANGTYVVDPTKFF